MSEKYIYLHYVDHTFSMIDIINKATHFRQQLNSLLQSLVLNMEVEEENSLTFLDVLVISKVDKFITSFYRKPNFTGLYTSWFRVLGKSN